MELTEVYHLADIVRQIEHKEYKFIFYV